MNTRDEDLDDAASGFEREEKTSPEVVRQTSRVIERNEKNPIAIVALNSAHERLRHIDLLTSDGWEAVEARDSDELLELTRTVAPQIVIVDAKLVTRTGTPVADAIKRQRPDAPLRAVALLAANHPAAIAEAIADGFDDFIADPTNEIETLARATANLRAARALSEVTRQRRDAALLLELSQTLASSLDMQLILHAVSRLVVEVIGLERCSIVILDPEQDDAVMVAASEDRSVKDLRIKLSGYPELKRCVETASPMLITDVAQETMLASVQQRLREKNVRTIALFPIVFEERVTGVLFLRSSKNGQRLTDAQIQFGQTVAASCAVAIRNARLFDQFQDQNERINSMRMVAERQTEALKKYQDFFEYAADGMAIIQADGQVLYVNKEGRRLLGRTRDDLLQLKFQEFLSPESQSRWRDVVDQLRHGRHKRSFDVYIGRGDGNERVFSLSAGGSGQETGLIILSFRDVTETREMEGELRTTKEFLENLIDNSVDAIVAADMNGNIMLFNKGAERIYGYRAEEVIGRMHVSQLYPPGIANDVMKKLRDDQWGGKGRLEASRREVVNVAGEVVPVSMSASIIYEDGEEVAMVGVFSDMRDRMAIERQLNEAKDQLNKTEKARVAAELAGMAAHELNQPLTSVLGYAEMLRNRINENDERLRRPVDTIFKQAERMAEIVRKIGRITKYETKRYGLNTDMIDLNRASIDEDVPVVAGRTGARSTPTRGLMTSDIQDVIARTDTPSAMNRPSSAPELTPRTGQRPAPASPGLPSRATGAEGAYGRGIGPPQRHDTPSMLAGVDPRSAVVRMDTVHDERTVVRPKPPSAPITEEPEETQRHRRANSATETQELRRITDADIAAAERADAARAGSTNPGRKAPAEADAAGHARALRAEQADGADGSEHTNPGMRISDVQKKAPR